MKNVNNIEWPEFISNENKKNDQNLLKLTNATTPYENNLNKVLKFDSDHGAHVMNYDSLSRESRRFWLCEMAQHLKLKKTFCISQTKETF